MLISSRFIPKRVDKKVRADCLIALSRVLLEWVLPASFCLEVLANGLIDQKGKTMVSEHAMLILILLLAVAVVLLAVAIMFTSGKIDKRLTSIERRIDATGAASSKKDA